MDFPPPPRLRVLCVDDNRDAADSMSMLLELLGYEVRVSYNGPAAIEAAKAFRPDACLLDYNMPGMDGCELARRLRGLAGRRPLFLVATTAHGSVRVRCLTASAGFNVHLVKPLDLDALEGALSGFERSLGRTEAAVTA